MSRSRRDISGTHTAAEPSIGAVAVSAAAAVSTLLATRASRTAIAGSARAPRAPNRCRNGEPRYLSRPVTVLVASSALSHARARRTTIERAGTFSCRAGIRSSSALGAEVIRWSLHAGPLRMRRAGPLDVTSVHDAVCSEAVPQEQRRAGFTRVRLMRVQRRSQDFGQRAAVSSVHRGTGRENQLH